MGFGSGLEKLEVAWLTAAHVVRHAGLLRLAWLGLGLGLGSGFGFGLWLGLGLG